MRCKRLQLPITINRNFYLKKSSKVNIQVYPHPNPLTDAKMVWLVKAGSNILISLWHIVIHSVCELWYHSVSVELDATFILVDTKY